MILESTLLLPTMVSAWTIHSPKMDRILSGAATRIMALTSSRQAARLAQRRSMDATMISASSKSNSLPTGISGSPTLSGAIDTFKRERR